MLRSVVTFPILIEIRKITNKTSCGGENEVRHFLFSWKWVFLVSWKFLSGPIASPLFFILKIFGFINSQHYVSQPPQLVKTKKWYKFPIRGRPWLNFKFSILQVEQQKKEGRKNRGEENRSFHFKNEQEIRGVMFVSSPKLDLSSGYFWSVKKGREKLFSFVLWL